MTRPLYQRFDFWPPGAKEREMMDDLSPHGEPSQPSGEHVASLAEAKRALAEYRESGRYWLDHDPDETIIETRCYDDAS